MKNETIIKSTQEIGSSDLTRNSAIFCQSNLASLLISTKGKGLCIFLIGIWLALNSCNSDDGTSPVDNPPEPTGSILVKISTVGGDDDPDGYTLLVQGSPDKEVEANSELSIGNKRVGRYNVELTNISSHCAGTGTMSREVNVTANGTVTVEFEVDCKAILKDRIAYTKGLDNFTEFKYFSSKLDGSDEKVILDQVISFVGLRISPDGTKLTFTDRVVGTNMQQVFVMDADGQNVKMIPYIQTENPGLAAQFNSIWHPDGKKLTFRNASKTVTYDLETDERKELEFATGELFAAEEVFESGNKLLGIYFRNRPGEPSIRYLATVNTDGSELKFLKETTDLVFFNPRILNENKIVYFQRALTAGSFTETWQVNLDGSEDINISDKMGFAESDRLQSFTLSPDKSEFLFYVTNTSNSYFAKTKVNGTLQYITFPNLGLRRNPEWSLATKR